MPVIHIYILPRESEKNKEEGERKSSNQSINFNKTAAITFKMAAAGVQNEEIVYDKTPEHDAK